MSDQQALDDAARREVLELEAKIYADPMSRHNVGSLLAPEFWDVSPTGEKLTRESVLERHVARCAGVVAPWCEPCDRGRIPCRRHPSRRVRRRGGLHWTCCTPRALDQG